MSSAEQSDSIDAAKGQTLATDPLDPLAFTAGEPEAGAGSTSVSEGIVRNAGIASFAVLLSRMSGLVREMVMARMFGAGLANERRRLRSDLR